VGFLNERLRHAGRTLPVFAALRVTGRLAAAAALVVLLAAPGKAQFSPGELSRPHAQLEGTTNCATCHDVGHEISGKKCLVCHTEIAAALRATKGMHGSMSDRQSCSTCHKEHLGRDAAPTLFKKETFDHAATGFLLTGKHASVKCDDCHKLQHVRDDQIRKIVTTTGRKSYLGLQPACASCHADRHEQSLGSACQTCHDCTAWKPASGFDHRKTDFRLEGEHAKVACVKCHEGMTAQEGKILFTAKAFADCTPCHASPHNEKFTRAACSTCHRTEGWSRISETKFNHDLTGFRLDGRHRGVRCEQCHGTGPVGDSKTHRKRPSTKCEGCHADAHRGQLTSRYANACARCHTTHEFSPSTFALADHDRTKFKLTGAHLAIPCGRCHKEADGKSTFRFATLSCEECHKDPHAGRFTKIGGVKRTCEQCHVTSDWKQASFDHATTGFPLLDKHLAVPCSRCHGEEAGRVESRARGTVRECEACHKDVHGSQFVSAGATRCGTCHSPAGWPKLVFNHQTQSAFSLTGGHTKVPCTSCHREEHTASGDIVRYKPLPTRCESCHTQKRISNG
jgi:hypothetical protein